MNSFENQNLTTIIPIGIGSDRLTSDAVINDISELHEKYGYDLFVLNCPSKGWRAKGLPPIEEYESLAEKFVKIKNALAPKGITVGWWSFITIKAGADGRFTPMMRQDGSTSAIGLCPLDKRFSEALCARMARFAEIAKPALILTEDDFSVHAATGGFGCFCEHHLREFAKREGKAYTREELFSIFSKRSPESLPLLRRWRELMKDTVVGLASDIRRAIDKSSPEIPIGCCQPGAIDADGDATEDFARALAGPRHTPFSRLYGTYYCGGDSKEIPTEVYHMLYSKQHIKEPFRYYHEADSFPHTRYFTSGTQMKVFMSAAMSFGFDGFLMQHQQFSDAPNEEAFVFGKMHLRERKKFAALAKVTRECNVKGVEITYDPFLFRAAEDLSSKSPLWTRCLSYFSIPYTTERAKVAFWDERMAKLASDEVIKEYLSGTLFLEANGAKYLIERGYGEYLGIDIGTDVSEEGALVFDLEAKEVIADKYVPDGRGKRMPAAHMFAQGKNGFMPRITVVDPKVEVISELRDFMENAICPGICKFKNSLGGTVVVMGVSLNKNGSQSLLNRRRARLIAKLATELGADIAYPKEEPCLFTVMNEPKSKDAEFLGTLSLTNLCEDDISGVEIYLPEKWRGVTEILLLDGEGKWNTIDFEKTADGVKISEMLYYSEPTHLMFK